MLSPGGARAGTAPKVTQNVNWSGLAAVTLGLCFLVCSGTLTSAQVVSLQNTVNVTTNASQANLTMAPNATIRFNTSPTVGCTPDRCNITSPTANATMKDYFACMVDAGVHLAFRCRCTTFIKKCLETAEGGNCTVQNDVNFHCRQQISEQGLNCNPVLCRNGAPGRWAVGFGAACVFLAVVWF